MKYVIVLLCALLPIKNGAKNGAYHSSQWVCTLANMRTYDYAIWNTLITQGVPCFDELMEIPKLLENETPGKTFTVYQDIGPFIGDTSTFRIMAVLEEEVDKVDLGPILPGEYTDECLKCTGNFYKGDMFEVICNQAVIQKCPDRLTGGMHWGQPEGSKITYSSPVVYCSYKQRGDTNYYYCKDYLPEVHVVP
ncbi:uncharacterized protein [Ptychodera flava]|uniref:uncharacterized protein n=1 Tax=Ptychodera flava TaxID=63121 RepID=UPI00396A21E0